MINYYVIEVTIICHSARLSIFNDSIEKDLVHQFLILNDGLVVYFMRDLCILILITLSTCFIFLNV